MYFSENCKDLDLDCSFQSPSVIKKKEWYNLIELEMGKKYNSLTILY